MQPTRISVRYIDGMACRGHTVCLTGQCCLCLEDPVAVSILFDCGHWVCEDCPINRLEHCPECRRRIFAVKLVLYPPVEDECSNRKHLVPAETDSFFLTKHGLLIRNHAGYRAERVQIYGATLATC